LNGHIRMTNGGKMMHLVVKCPITGVLKTFFLKDEVFLEEEE